MYKTTKNYLGLFVAYYFTIFDMNKDILEKVLNILDVIQRYNTCKGIKNVELTNKLLSALFVDIEDIKEYIEHIFATDMYKIKYSSFIIKTEKIALEKITKAKLSTLINNGEIDNLSFQEYERLSGVKFKRKTEMPLKDFLEVIRFFNDRYNKKTTLTNTSMQLILQVLENGHSIDDIKHAFIGREKDVWWKANNLLDNFETLFRIRSQQGTPVDYIEKFSSIGSKEGALYKKEQFLEAGRKVKKELGLQDDSKIITLANGGSWTANMFTNGVTFEYAKSLIDNLQKAYKNFISVKK